jgi:4-hydroxy-tetrahydrodipicolinate synthase
MPTFAADAFHGIHAIDHAVRAYERMLPAVGFTMQGIENLLCYGKRLFGVRAGIAIHDRSPALRPVPAGDAMVARFAETLGPLGDPHSAWP